MDYELLLNKQKSKKQESLPSSNEKLKKIIALINSISDDPSVIDREFNLLDKKKDLDTDIIESFRDFIINYCKLKKNLSIENSKHIFIKSIIDRVVNGALKEIDLLEKSVNNPDSDLKKITNCILNDSDKKTIKLNLIKSQKHN